MARTFTLAQMRTKVRERADMVNSTFCTDSEIEGYISSSYAELYDLLVKSGMAYFESTHPITTDGVDGLYALPSDYYATLAVDYNDGSEWHEVPMFQLAERNAFPSSSGYALGYRIVGDNIELKPNPPTGQSYRILYVPAPANPPSTIDGVSGWEEFIVVDAAIKCLQKEESATGHLVGERNRIIQRIEEHAQNRLFGQPLVIRDVSQHSNPLMWDSERWR